MTATSVAGAQTIYSAFSDTEQAKRAVGALLDHGVSSEDISIVVAKGSPDYYLDSSDMWNMKEQATTGITTTTSADATVGAAKGAGLGFGVGALAALACLIVPGFGMVVGGGALAAAIAGTAGATAAGAVAGGIHGYLKDQGVSSDDISHYGDAYDAGDTLVAVSLPSNDITFDKVDEILTKYSGQYIKAFDIPGDGGMQWHNPDY